MAQATEPSDDQKKANQSSYLKYSGLAVQLLAAIGFLGWLGHRLDLYLKITFPAFLLTFGFLAFVGMMVQIYRSINR